MHAKYADLHCSYATPVRVSDAFVAARAMLGTRAATPAADRAVAGAGCALRAVVVRNGGWVAAVLLGVTAVRGTVVSIRAGAFAVVRGMAISVRVVAAARGFTTSTRAACAPHTINAPKKIANNPFPMNTIKAKKNGTGQGDFMEKTPH
ncbi:MAG: hypothetical protein FWG18_03695 [Alphaproteobacteria bacterium]|nr:hypothetical protein [Alphaproteobacteria bacterium]